jgi:hypothetical protein
MKLLSFSRLWITKPHDRGIGIRIEDRSATNLCQPCFSNRKHGGFIGFAPAPAGPIRRRDAIP